MKLSDFDYQISPEHIAQSPLPLRDSSKLFIVHRVSGEFEHRTFRDIANYLQPGDVLVLNDTKVIPARLFGTKSTGGKVEIMLLKELSSNTWEALVKGLREGQVILNNDIIATVSRLNGTNAKVTFAGAGLNPAPADIKKILCKIGVVPLPPYIKRTAVPSDSEQYQTVYANREGAVAAPTAGLHFTEKLLAAIKEKGIVVERITLHVGYGTFKPVTADNINEHTMDEEYYEVPEAAARAINHAKSEGRKIVTVGTTVTRALESAAIMKNGEWKMKDSTAQTSIFIYPGYKFKVVDTLITNFHLPKSTPMMLTSAFCGLNLLKKAYSEAQRKDYRFFSYGDAMLII